MSDEDTLTTTQVVSMISELDTSRARVTANDLLQKLSRGAGWNDFSKRALVQGCVKLDLQLVHQAHCGNLANLLLHLMEVQQRMLLIEVHRTGSCGVTLKLIGNRKSSRKNQHCLLLLQRNGIIGI